MATATRWSARNFPSLDDAFSNVAYAAFNKLDAIQGKDTGSCSTDGDSSDDDSELGTIDKCIEFPPGSLFDSPRCISPTDIRDFPELQLTAPWLDNDDEDVDPSNPFDARLAALNNNVYVPIRCTARILSLGGDSSRVFKVQTDRSTSSMADSGANCCLTPHVGMLVDIVDIEPITVGLALSNNNPDTITTASCSKMGYLPMPLADGSFHYQPFFVNTSATDTIMSPECIVHSNPKFKRWVQSGQRGTNTTGSLQIIGYDGTVLLDLTLSKKNGLYYSSNETFITDSDPLRTQCSVAAIDAYMNVRETVTTWDDPCYVDSCEALKTLLDVKDMETTFDDDIIGRLSLEESNTTDINLDGSVHAIISRASIDVVNHETRQVESEYILPSQRRTPIPAKRKPVDPRQHVESEL